MSLSAFAVPVFLDTNANTEQLLRQWIQLYRYGHMYIPALCIVTFGLYAYVSLSRRASSHKQWYQYGVAATLTISMVPFTWVAVAQTNNTLFRMESRNLATELTLARALVLKWVWLHVMRSLFPLFGAIIGFVSLLQEKR